MLNIKKPVKLLNKGTFSPVENTSRLFFENNKKAVKFKISAPAAHLQIFQNIHLLKYQ